MAANRYTSLVKATFPLDWFDPRVTVGGDSGPDAVATGDGLSIQDKDARLYAGALDPNGNVKAFMGSFYYRTGADSEYSAYIKTADDGGDTGWFPIGPASKEMTFGLTDDTIGENTAQHYGNILEQCYVAKGQISVVGLPTTDDAIFDIFFSDDGGLIWKSVLPPGNADDDAVGAYNLTKIIFPKVSGDISLASHVVSLPLSTFGGYEIPEGSIMRIDTKQSGGASGITITLKLGAVTVPQPSLDLSNSGGGGGIMIIV